MDDVPKTTALAFDGYWREPAVSGLPASAGVYCVYTCTYNKNVKPNPTVSIAKLVYIGESDNVRTRVGNHELLPTWKKQLTGDQVLCFSAATVSPEETRQRAEAALIFKHKPPINTEYTKAFPFDTTTINSSGTTRLLTTSFTVPKGVTSS
jgi:excinuclease UvrABC nuclease subunit